jgi:3'(2'), 5'-bisphosphate nucleotidase
MPAARALIWPVMETTNATLERLMQIARAAGDAIMPHYASAEAPGVKADGSPVTAADRASHHVIADALDAWDPSIPIVSEEGALPPYAERAEWPRFWLVDPLDGTKEFLKRNGEFTVNIALVEHGVPVLGVVHAPALGLTYAAGRGLGAWKRAAGRPPGRLASAPKPAGTPLVVAESRSHPSPELEAFIRTIPVARSGGRRHGGHLPAVRPDDGMGQRGGRLRLPVLRTGRRAGLAAAIQHARAAQSAVRDRAGRRSDYLGTRAQAPVGQGFSPGVRGPEGPTDLKTQSPARREHPAAARAAAKRPLRRPGRAP